MADKFKKVAHLCQWCGLGFHTTMRDQDTKKPMAIFNDYDGKQYCTLYCAKRGYAYYNGFLYEGKGEDIGE